MSKQSHQSIYKPNLLLNQVAIVTGGGTGIGKQIALELGYLGCKICICGRREEPLQKACQEFTEKNITCTYKTCDIRNVNEIKAFVQHVLKTFGTIDILVNNAGGQFPIPAKMLSPKGFAAVIQNNLIGTWNMTSVVATQVFIPQKKGKIINIIAQIARGFPGMVHTGSARAGVDNLTKTLAIEWAPYGINVNAVAPGIILSSGTERYDVGILKNAIKAIPKGRAGKVEEVAALVAFLCTPIADFITGQTYYIDGGQSLFGDIIDPRKWAKSKL